VPAGDPDADPVEVAAQDQAAREASAGAEPAVLWPVAGHEVGQDERADAGLLGDGADLIDGGVGVDEVLVEALLGVVAWRGQEPVDPGGVDDLVDQEVCPGGQLDEVLGGPVSPEKTTEPSSVSNRKPIAGKTGRAGRGWR